ncbi:MAG: formylglycine-generating enzyme family protein, partial [Candidatus Brocadiia bacterium]
EPVAGEVRDVTDRSMPDDYPDWVKDAPFWLVRIDPGSFAMGTEKGDYLELPIHQVTLTREFFIGATEVTQAQYRTVMKENPSELRGDSLPVEDVTWDDAMAFCSRLTSTEHAAGRLPEEMEYRLPTEAEWEYCCRAGSTTEFCFGDDPALLGDYAWFKANSEERSHPVGEKKPNPWGLFDMHGNAWEWCLDHFGSYDAAGEIDPIGLSDDKHRMTRGGSWYFSADFSTSAKRFDDRHGVHGWNGYGLRVVVALIDERPR